MRYRPSRSIVHHLVWLSPLAALLAGAGCTESSKDEPQSEFVVIGATPSDQATNADGNLPVIVRFNQPVNLDSYTGTNQIILVDGNNSPVPMQITPASGDAASEFITITPAVPFAANTTYGVAVREMVDSIHGRLITTPWAMTFSTGAFVGSIPGFPPFLTPTPTPASAGAPGTFTLSGRMITGRSRHQAARLMGGEVAVFGGLNPVPGGTVLTSVEIYRPTAGTWAASGATNGRGMRFARYGHTATTLANGKVLITGGTDNAAIWDSAELYDPFNDSFGPTATLMTLPRAHHTATRIGNGNVILAGGFAYNVAGNASGGSSSFAVITDTIEVFDVPSGTFLNSSQRLTREKMYHTATRLPGGDVVFMGGYILPYNAAFWCPTTAMTDRYSPNLAQGVGEVASLQATGSLKTPRFNHTTTLYTTGQAQGLAMVIAGYETSPFSALLGSAEVFDPNVVVTGGAQGAFALVAANLGETRRAHTSTVLGAGKDAGRILVVGGTTNPPPLQAPVSSAPPHTWTSADGSSCGSCFNRNTAELFDPFGFGQNIALPFKGVDITGRFTPAVNLSGVQAQMVGTNFLSWMPGAGRSFHTATALSSGHVLLAGGWDCPFCGQTRGGDTALATSEVYNP